MRLRLTKPVLILLLTATSLMLFVGPVARVRGEPSLPVVGVWSNAYGSSNVTDPSNKVGSSVTFEINVTNAPSFNGYELYLYYDPSYLSAKSTDFATSTVFNNPFAGKNDLSTPGIVSVAVVNLGSSFDSGSGTLMHVTFQVKKIGVSPVSLAQGTAQPGPGASGWTRLVLGFSTIDVSTTDGYFRNDPSHLGPVASFTFTMTPNVAGLGQTVIFDGSASFDPGNSSGVNQGISEYIWNFGDGNGLGGSFPVAVHTYDQGVAPGNFSVTLTVIDRDDGFEGMTGQLATVQLTRFTPFLIFTDTGSPGLPPIQFTAGSSSTSSVFAETFVNFPVNLTMTSHTSPTVSNGPTISFSPNPVQVLANSFGNSFMTISTTPSTPAGNYGIIITGTDENVTSSIIVLLRVLQSSSFPEIFVTSFFANLGGHPLPKDSLGSPRVNVVIAHGILRATGPGQVAAWSNVTNIGTTPLGSVRVEDQLPVDWAVSQTNHQTQDSIRVFLEEQNGTLVQLTHNFTVAIGGVRQQTVFLNISNTTLALPSPTFDRGESILLSVKLDYQLVGNHVSPASFPVTYRSAVLGLAWTMAGEVGTMVSANGAGIFNAYAKIWGDANGDLKVNIEDLALVAYSFGSTPGSTLWNPAANLDGSGQIDIGDLAIVAINYGDSY